MQGYYPPNNNNKDKPDDQEQDRVIRRGRNRRKLLIPAIRLILIAVLIFSAVSLIRYAIDYFSIRSQQNEMAQLYHSGDDQTAVPQETASVTAAMTASTEEQDDPAATPAEETAAGSASLQETEARLPKVPYANNGYLVYQESIRKLKRKNEDIVGWLEIDGVIQTPVVQRDNEYYLRRDYNGNHNANGCIFLDESADLKTRPYLLMLFGHNMKTEEMFGFLHRYGAHSYFREHALITFNTQYEDGQYVAFSAATVDINRVNLYRLYSDQPEIRDASIAELTALSEIVIPIDVRADDQLLVLVTCNGNDHQRRILAARRIRDGEDIEAVKRSISQVYPK